MHICICIRRRDATRVLGTVVGGDPGITAASVRDLFQADHDQLIKCIKDPSMSLQMCVLMMRMVLAPSVVHILRTSPPDETEAVCAHVDRTISETIAARFGFPADAVPAQCFLRMRDGGLGLPKAARVAPLAFWSSFAQACALLSHAEHAALATSDWITNALEACFQSQSMRDAAAEVDARLPPSATPARVLDFYRAAAPPRRLRAAHANGGLPAPPAQQLQRALNHAALATERAQFLSGHDKKSPLSRRIDACAGAGGTAWLSCCPTTKFSTIKDRDYRAAVRLRLGVIPVEVPVSHCNVCRRRPAFADAPSHMVSCTKSMHCNSASTLGHSLVGNAMVHYLTLAGMVCRPEVRFLRANRKTRPDYLVFDAHGNTLLTDHTVINPISASRAARAVSDTLEAAARIKHGKYDNDARNLGAVFAPMVCSVFGLLHPTALSVLRLQAAQASDAHANRFPGGKKSLINAMISAVSCAIQKRNGIIIHTTLQKILAAAPPPQVAIIIP